MARYAIGDIQGCYAELSTLLTKIRFDPAHDQLFSVGDIVNRGPDSLSVLRWMYQHRDSVHMVLGNHDLHLLALGFGHAKKKSRDTVDAVLQAKDSQILLEWLRYQPLFSVFEGFCLVHAGVWPGWNINEACVLAQEAETALQSNPQDFFQQLYGNEPNSWSSHLEGAARLRFIVNSMTRMRTLDQNRSLDFSYKSTLDAMPAHLSAWYQFPRPADAPRIICGHWSALSLQLMPDVWALDTGCVWGGSLTMVNCDTGEIFQQPAII